MNKRPTSIEDRSFCAEAFLPIFAETYGMVKVAICVLALAMYGRVLAQEVDSARIANFLRHLSSASMEGRQTNTPGGRRAAEYIAARFKDIDLEPMGATYFQPFPLPQSTGEGRNVIAYIKGKNNPDKYILLSAHYDHLGLHNDSLYYGADDNASGVALMLEIAHYFKQNPPKNSIIFAAFDAEEINLLGSDYFVKNPPIALRNIMLNLNFDMISRGGKKNIIYIVGLKQNPQLKPLVDRIIKSNTSTCTFKIGHDGSLPSEKSWLASSDHFNLYKKKVPFLYFGVEDHADYHKPSDKFEKINLHFYTQVALRILKSLVWYDSQFSTR